MSAGTLRVVVVGGGISGLSCAYALIRDANREGRSLRLTVLEASGRLGGNVGTERTDGFVIESGPDSFVTTRPFALHLCEELGLGSRLIETLPQNRRVYIAQSNKLVPLPDGLVLGIPTSIRSFMRSPLLSTRGKLRALREMTGAAREVSGGDTSLGDFLERRFGKEMVDVVLEPLLGGIYAGDAYRLSLRSTFPDWLGISSHGASLIRTTRAARKEKQAEGNAGSPFRSLVSGMGELVDALSDKVGRGAIRVRAKVVGAEQRGASFRVKLTEGEIEADQLVVALPAYAAAEIVAAVDRGLADELAGIEYVSTAVVTFGYERRQIRHPLDAAGILVPKREGRKITAGTFNSSKWAGRAPEGAALVRGFVGGAHDEATANLPDEALVATVQRDLEDLLGIAGEPRIVRVSRYLKASPQPVVGHLDRVSRIRARLERLPGLFVIGNAYDGVGIPDCIRHAERAAASIRAASYVNARTGQPARVESG